MSKERVVPFKVDYYDITGNHLSALVLVQLEYWQPKAFNGWISKTEKEWKQELRVTYKMLQRIQDNLVELGFIDVKQAMYKDRKTTHYRVNTATIKAAIELLNPNPVLTKGQLDERSILPKVNITKGELIDCPKVNSNTAQRSILYTESITESITENKETETSSVVPDGLFKFDFIKQEAEKAIAKNEAAKPKSKKPKEPTDELTAEIHKYVCEAHDYLKKWHEAKYESPMLTYDKDFKNLKSTFRKIIEGSVSFEEAKRITAQKCFNGVKYFVDNFDKLDSYHQKKFSLNHIATNWNELKESIQKYKAPIPKPNTFDPPPVVSVKLPSIYNGVPLPIGIEVGQFRELSKEVYRDKVMEGDINDGNTSLTDFMQAYQYQLRKLSPEQLKQLLNDYGII
jgi:hypothetical protein